MTRPPLRRDRRLAGIPVPLLGLLLAVFVLGAGWAFVTPAMQAPDEQVHVGYSQYLAETGKLPGGDLDRGMLSVEQYQAADSSNADRSAMQLGIKMSWNRAQYQAWRDANRKTSDADRQNGGGASNAAASNPPLYYLSTVPAYLAASGSDFYGRVTAMRLTSVLWMLLTVIAAWLLAGELFARRRLLQTAMAGIVGFAPMTLFISSSVTPDAALFASWGIVLWLGARLLNHGITVRGVLALCAALGIASVVKATSYALVPAVAFVLLVALIRGLRSVPRPSVVATPRAVSKLFGAAALGLLVTLGVWIVVSRIVGVEALAQGSDVANGGGAGGLRGFVSYVWQFYLPLLPGMNPVLGQAPLPVYDILIPGLWAAYGWLEVVFPPWFYAVAAAVTAIVAVLAFTGLWRDRRRVDWMIGGFFVLATAGLLFGIHWTEFGKGGTSFVQGRYLLPLSPLAAAAAVRAILWVPRRHQGAVVGAVLGGLLIFNLFSWGLVLERFYA